MKTLCLYNQEATFNSGLKVEAILEGRPHWGKVVFYPLQPKDISKPGWVPLLSGLRRLLIVGGDGTLHHTIQYLVNKPVEINIIPAGTANDFARWIGMPCNPLESLRLLEAGKTIKYDTIRVNGRHVISGGGFGLGFSVAVSANHLRKATLGKFVRRMVGDNIYSLLLVWHSFATRHKRVLFRIEDGSGFREYKSHACIFTNQAELGKNIVVAPGTKSTDGLFHFLLFKNPSCPSVLYSVLKIKMGCHRKDRYQLRNEARKICIHFDKKLPAFGDGEPLPESDTWDICCQKESLTIRVSEKFNG